jgi:hypothetical protein
MNATLNPPQAESITLYYREGSRGLQGLRQQLRRTTTRRRQRGRAAFLCGCFPDAGDFSVSAVSSSPSPVLAPAKDMSL